MVFSKNLSHYRQIDLATLESSHGREHPSTASELANKAMQSLKGRFESQLTSDNLEGFFSALIHREPIKTTTLSETMKANPELNMEIMKLAKAFGLVETVTTLRNPRPRPSSHTTTSRWEQLRLNDDEISTEINEPSLDATADQHLSESDDDEEGLNLTAEQMGVVAEHPPSEDVKESEEDSLLEKRSGQKK